MVRGESLTKTASQGDSLDSFTPEQLNSLAERLEKSAHVKEASDHILEMHNANQGTDASDPHLKKLAYQQALRELGFPEGMKLSAASMLFGDSDAAQLELAKTAADASMYLIGNAVHLGLSEEGEGR